jgi:hypothetical protein
MPVHYSIALVFFKVVQLKLHRTELHSISKLERQVMDNMNVKHVDTPEIDPTEIED